MIMPMHTGIFAYESHNAIILSVRKPKLLLHLWFINAKSLSYSFDNLN